MVHLKRWLVPISIASFLFLGSGQSVANITTDENELASIQTQLSKMVENSTEAVITPTPVAGLYQIQIGMTVVYMSQDGRYLLNGGLVDLTTRTNLAEQAKSTARKNILAEIPSSSMIIYPAKGQERHYVTVFADIDCPYCTKLHKEIPELNQAGITVRYLAFPRAGLGSPSYDKAVSAWCAKEPAKAMDEAMLGKALPKMTCDNPIKEHMMLARRFEVNGTPNIILDNGELLPGYVPAKELIKIFKQ